MMDLVEYGTLVTVMYCYCDHCKDDVGYGLTGIDVFDGKCLAVYMILSIGAYKTYGIIGLCYIKWQY